MARITGLIAFLVMVTAGAAGAGPKITTDKLENGLEIVTIEDHRAPVVVHMLWYKAGAADEERGVSGIAHFLEHLMFKATTEHASGEFNKVVEANGGSDNAFTTQDYTAYFQRVAADRLPLMMEYEADRMRHLKLTEDDIRTERQVIIEERNMRIENSPDALFSEQRSAAQYLNSPYGTPTIGWRHEMENLQRADALAFYKKYYAPNDAVLVVAGDVTPEEVKTLAEKYYGPLEPTPGLGERHRPQEPRQMAARHLVYKDPRVSENYVVRGYLAPERNAGDQRKAAALTLLAKLLGGSGATSFLGHRLQFDQKTAIYAAAGYSGVSYDPTTFMLYVVPVEGRSLDQAEKDLDDGLAAFFRQGVDKDQLERIKMQIRAADIYADDSTRSLAQRYGQALTSGLTVADVQAWPDILQSITPEEIMAAAHEVLVPEHSVTGWLMKPEVEATQ